MLSRLYSRVLDVQSTCDVPSGANSFFIRTIIDKKYALPYKVIDGLVQHFLRFEHEERQLPVVWHHALLAFAQRYKLDIKDEDKSRLRHLLKTQHHKLVTPEIRRELEYDQVAGNGMSQVASAGDAMETD